MNLALTKKLKNWTAKMKLCRKCKINKDFSCFSKDSKKLDNLNIDCKECVKEYRAINRDKIKEYNRKHYLDNRDRILKNQRDYNAKTKEKIKEYRAINRDKRNAQSREWYAKNKEYAKEYAKEYYYKNKEYYSQRAKRYRDKNKERIDKKNYEWKKEKIKTDSVFAFKCHIRKIIGNSIKKKGFIKKDSTELILGCDFSFFEKHLAKTFENRYNIPLEQAKDILHIDHIVPLSVAKTEAEVIKLNHYSNLQYLYASDNLEKSDSLDWKKL